ncbi:MAG: cupin domain-containing protein [Silanimonas sp.]
MSDRPCPIINLDALTPRLITAPTDESPAKYQGAMVAPISPRIGAQKLGYNVTIVPPGKAAFPAHNHYGNEEMFLVLEGEGELRVGAERFPLRTGDVIACPVGGPETAHQIRNTSASTTLRYLAVSTMISPDLYQYPDSGKTGASHFLGFDESGERRIVRLRNREADNLGYWDGE